jgi:hypothetical protein
MCSDDEEGAGGANVRIVRPRTPRTALGKFAAAAPSTRSAATGLYLNNAPLQQLDVTAQVVAICATIEHLAWTTGKAPTFSALLKAPRSSPLGDWAGNERRWTPEARAHLILSLVGLRAVRILRFASLEPDASAAPPGFRTYNYPSAPLAVNPDALAEYVHSARRIVLNFPAAIYPRRIL